MVTDVAAPQSDPYERTREMMYARLGLLLVQANMLEDAVLELYWIVTQRPLLEVVAEARDLTLGRLVERFIGAYLKLVPATTLVARFEALKPRLLAAVLLRNEFVHAGWAIAADGTVDRERRPRKDRPRVEIVTMRPEHIEEAAEEIGAVAEAVWDLHDETVAAMGGRLPPQPGEVRDGATYPGGYEHRDLTK